MITYGRFFTAIQITEQSQTADIRKKTSWDTGQLPYSDCESMVFLSDVLVPAFLYDVSQPGKKTPQPAKLPSAPVWKRKGLNAELKTEKLIHSDRKRRLFIQTEENEISIPITSPILLPAGYFESSLNSGNSRIILKDSDFRWVLEESVSFKIDRPDGNAAGVLLETRLSLRDFLDPDEGISRLHRDIQNGSYHAPPGLTRNQLGTLLDIIRSADYAQEESILQSIYEYQPGLFAKVMSGLFQPELLPYMKRQEVSQIIMRFSDRLLGMIRSSPQLSARYKSFISARRFDSLPNLPAESADPIWDQILQHFTTTRRRFFRSPMGKVQHFQIEKGQTLFLSPENMISIYGDLRVLCLKDQSLILIAERDIISPVMIYQDQLRKYQYRAWQRISAGVICIPDFPRLPSEIFLAGFIKTDKGLRMTESASFIN